MPVNAPSMTLELWIALSNESSSSYVVDSSALTNGTFSPESQYIFDFEEFLNAISSLNPPTDLSNASSEGEWDFRRAEPSAWLSM